MTEEFLSKLERIKNKECSNEEITSLFNTENNSMNRLVLYYLCEYMHDKAAYHLQKWALNSGRCFGTLEQSALILDLAKDALPAAIDLGLPAVASLIANNRKPPITAKIIGEILQKGDINFLKEIVSLGLYIKGMKRRSSSRDAVRLMRQILREGEDPGTEIKVSDIVDIAFRNDIPIETIMTLCIECRNLDDGGGISSLINHGREEEALALLSSASEMVNSKSLLLALNNNCLRYAVEFTGRLMPLKGTGSRVFGTLFRKISTDIELEMGNLDIYIYIIRKYVKEMKMQDAIKFAKAVEFITSPDGFACNLWKLLNPVKFILQLIQLTTDIAARFDVMSMRFVNIIGDLNQLGLDLMGEIKTDQQVKYLLFDKDLDNRDSLDIILEYHLIDFLNNAMIEKIASEVWNGPYEYSNNPLAPTSNIWKLISYSRTAGERDVEEKIRNKIFSKNVVVAPAHQYVFAIWRTSAGVRLLALMLEYIGLTLCLFTAELFLRAETYKMEDIERFAAEEGREYKNFTPEEKDQYYQAALESRDWVFWWDFYAICLMLGTSRIVLQGIFQYLSGRNKAYVNLEWVLNLLIFLSHLILFMPLEGEKTLGMEHARLEGEELIELVVESRANAYEDIIAAIIIFCLGLRLAYMLRYTNFLGPLITMLKSMIKKIAEFAIFFFVVLFVFSLSATLIFPSDDPEFSRVDYIVLTLLQTSVNVFDLNPPEKYSIQCKIFFVIFIFTTNITLLNLIIAILSEIYAVLSTKSHITLYKEIISLRDQYKPHSTYQFMVSSYFIFDAVLFLVFIPFYPLLERKTRVKLNMFLLYLEYTFLFVIILPIYIIVLVILMPFAYFMTIWNKLGQVFKGKNDGKTGARILSVLIFFLFGFLFLTFYMFMDVYYYIIHSYNNQPVNKIDRELNDYITANSLRNVIDYLDELEHEELKCDALVKGIEGIFSKNMASPSIIRGLFLPSISRLIWIAQYATISQYIREISEIYKRPGYVDVKDMRRRFYSFLECNQLRVHIKHGFAEPVAFIEASENAKSKALGNAKSPLAVTNRKDYSLVNKDEGVETRLLVSAFKQYNSELYKGATEKYCSRDTTGVDMAIQIRKMGGRIEEIYKLLSHDQLAERSIHLSVRDEDATAVAPKEVETLEVKNDILDANAVKPDEKEDKDIPKIE